MSKVTTLAEAVRRHVRTGQVIQAANGRGFPTALLYAEAGVRRAQEKWSWPLRVLPDPSPLPPLEPSLVDRLRSFDPLGHLRF